MKVMSLFTCFLKLNETISEVSNTDGCVPNGVEFKFNFIQGTTL